MNINQLCMKCMIGKLNEEGKCTSCGASDSSEKNGSLHLPVRSILKGKYLIGKVIGEGGFGITYIGFDLDLEIRVAIKEFCPKQYVGREAEDGLTIYPYNEKDAEFFESEKQKYINEARRLAKFRNEGGVVSVLDYFIENGTAYIVMDYIDGMTLKSYLKTLHNSSDKNMSIAGVLNLFEPVMETLAKIHNANIIHRDISPENIMISKDFTKVYLIDFGTARDIEDGHTLSEYSKSFYTPIEQMSDKMKQGPWTDVYALCATIYVCITGRTLPESVSRLLEDDLVEPRKYGVDISEELEAVLIKGLAVKPDDRIQSMEELMQVLYGEESDSWHEEERVSDEETKSIEYASAEESTIQENSVLINPPKTTVERNIASIFFVIFIILGISSIISSGFYIFNIFMIVSDIIVLIALIRNKKDFVLIVGLLVNVLLYFRDVGAIFSSGDILSYRVVSVYFLLGGLGNLILGIISAGKGMQKSKEAARKMWFLPLICYTWAEVLNILNWPDTLDFNILNVINIISFLGGYMFLAKWLVNMQDNSK